MAPQPPQSRIDEVKFLSNSIPIVGELAVISSQISQAKTYLFNSKLVMKKLRDIKTNRGWKQSSRGCC
jgi:hypothetical protein